MKLLNNIARGGVRLSERGIQTVRQMLKGKTVTQEESGMSNREWGEMMEVLDMKVEAG